MAKAVVGRQVRILGLPRWLLPRVYFVVALAWLLADWGMNCGENQKWPHEPASGDFDALNYTVVAEHLSEQPPNRIIANAEAVHYGRIGRAAVYLCVCLSLCARE